MGGNGYTKLALSAIMKSTVQKKKVLNAYLFFTGYVHNYTPLLPLLYHSLSRAARSLTSLKQYGQWFLLSLSLSFSLQTLTCTWASCSDSVWSVSLQYIWWKISEETLGGLLSSALEYTTVAEVNKQKKGICNNHRLLTKKLKKS